MDPWPGNEDDITPVELAAELGHVGEARPGKKVRGWLRAHYWSNLPPKTRWHVPQDVADRCRAHFRGRA